MKGRGGRVIGHQLTKKTAAVRRVRRLEGAGPVRDLLQRHRDPRAGGEIRRVGRSSQGVTMRVEEGAHVVALAPVIMQTEV